MYLKNVYISVLIHNTIFDIILVKICSLLVRIHFCILMFYTSPATSTTMFSQHLSFFIIRKMCLLKWSLPWWMTVTGCKIRAMWRVRQYISSKEFINSWLLGVYKQKVCTYKRHIHFVNILHHLFCMEQSFLRKDSNWQSLSLHLIPCNLMW